MSNNASNVETFDGPFNDKKELHDMRYAKAICITPNQENRVFHVSSIMLHMLQMNGLFEGQAHEDSNFHLMNFMEVCASFDIAHISQKSIRFCLFPYSLTGEVVLWKSSLPVRSITLWDKLTDTFLDRYFLQSMMLQLRDEITNFCQLNREPIYEV